MAIALQVATPWQEPGADIAPGSLVSWVPVPRVPDALRLLQARGEQLVPIQADTVNRWATSGKEAYMVCVGKARYGIVLGLPYSKARPEYWVLPVFGIHEQTHVEDTPCIMRVPAFDKRGFAAGFVDFRKTVSLPEVYLRKAESIAELTAEAYSELTLAFGSWVANLP